MLAAFIHRAGLSLYSRTNEYSKHVLTKIFPEALSETTTSFLNDLGDLLTY